MRVGFILPQIGPLGTAENLVRVAQRAEELGYSSLCVTERILYPVNPQTPYPATPDGSLPEAYKHSLDPIETLTFAAAHTKKIRLRTSVLDIPFYNPVMLARHLTAVDVLSGGRLSVGLGQGWSKDEYEAVGASFKNRGARADEFLQVLKAIWTTDPVEFQGKFFKISKSIILPKPVQIPHPPIYLAAYAPTALKRIAHYANGWNPAGIPVEGMEQMMQAIKAMAKEAGRDPSLLELIVRGNVVITEKPLGMERWIFSGTLEQIRDDVAGCQRIGAKEVVFDPIYSPDGTSLDRFLMRMEQLRRLV